MRTSGFPPYTILKNKIICLVIIFTILVAVLSVKKALAPQHVEAQVISTSTPTLVSQTTFSISEIIERDFSPRMVRILNCESGLRQFNADGTTVISHTMDVGLAQINLKAHLRNSQKMGLDIINSLEDNLKYAKYLYDNESERPWVCAGLVS